jgi:UDPglucose 6-dehydrogenase
VADYWQQVVQINDWQKTRFVQRMVRTMFNTIAGKRIAVLGFAFKKDTNDTRESAAIDVCRALLAEKAQISIYDPKVTADVIINNLSTVTGLDSERLAPQVRCESDAYAAAHGADALVVLTEWDEFRTLDFARVYASMKKPAFAFDGRNILPHDVMREIGYDVHAIGKPAGSLATVAV